MKSPDTQITVLKFIKFAINSTKQLGSVAQWYNESPALQQPPRRRFECQLRVFVLVWAPMAERTAQLVAKEQQEQQLSSAHRLLFSLSLPPVIEIVRRAAEEKV